MNSPAQASVPLKPKAPTKASLWHLIFRLIALFSTAALLTFIISAINTPGKISQQLSITQPVFENYMLTISQITQHLEEDNDDSDSDTMEREGQKALDLSKRAQSTHDTLKSLSAQITITKLHDYQTYLNQYLQNTQKLILLEQENAKIYAHYAQVFRQYEEITITIENANLYVTSNPDKYVTEMNNAIEQEKALIKAMKQIETIEETREIVEYSPKILEIEVQFIEKMVAGVQHRDYNALTSAQQEYTRQQAQISKDINRIEDQFNELTNTLKRDADAQEDHIQNEYNRLVIQYRL